MPAQAHSHTDAAPHLYRFSDAAVGLQAFIAVDDTRLGPAFGGCRFVSYPDSDAAMADARRLAHGMTLKNALAGIPFGGGKAVIMRPTGDFDRSALFEAFGRCVAGLDGHYITAMDSGTETADMDAIARHCRQVSGASGREGDPSPFTARGMFDGIGASVRVVLGHDELRGVHVAIQGVGHVGGDLARRLAHAGAQLTIADPDRERASRVADVTGARVVAPEQLLSTPCDVLAPCGLGGVLDAASIANLRCRIVAGAANNQLAEDEDGARLAARGIAYVPDFVINAGGVIHAALAWRGLPPGEIARRVGGIGATVAEVLGTALDTNQQPERVALDMAHAVLERAGA